MDIKSPRFYDYFTYSSNNNNIDNVLENVCDNPYRILGIPCNASSIKVANAQDKIIRFNKLGVLYSSDFDFLEIGEVLRETSDINNAVANTSNPINKLFWFCDKRYIKDFGSPEVFDEYFNSQNRVTEIEYDCFLSNYVHIVLADPEFTISEHWEFLLKYVSEIMGLVEDVEYWDRLSQNRFSEDEKIAPLLLAQLFADNILLPVFKLSKVSPGEEDISACLNLAKIVKKVGYTQKPFEELLSTLFDFLEEWVQRKIDFIHDEFISKIKDANNPSREDLVQLYLVISYYEQEIQQNLNEIIYKIIPPEHTGNYRIREMFFDCFHHIAFLLYQGEEHEKSRNMLYILRLYAPDEILKSKVDDEINIVSRAFDRQSISRTVHKQRVTRYEERQYNNAETVYKSESVRVEQHPPPGGKPSTKGRPESKGFWVWLKERAGIIAVVGIIAIVGVVSRNNAKPSSTKSNKFTQLTTSQSLNSDQEKAQRIKELKNELDGRLVEIKNMETKLKDMEDELGMLELMYNIDKSSETANKYNSLFKDYENLYKDYSFAVNIFNSRVKKYNELIGK